MTGAVEDAMRANEERDRQEFLKALVTNGDITGSAAGITKMVIDGRDLTEKQAFVFKRDVEDKFPQPECEQCGDLIPWSEAYEHVHGGGLCASCQHSHDRFMAD